jgi:hypothetical protein
VSMASDFIADMAPDLGSDDLDFENIDSEALATHNDEFLALSGFLEDIGERCSTAEQVLGTDIQSSCAL